MNGKLKNFSANDNMPLEKAIGDCADGEVVHVFKSPGSEETEACYVPSVISGSAVEKLKNSSVEKLVTTDTVFIADYKQMPQRVIVRVAGLFAKAIMSTNRGESISALYDKF